MESLALLTAPNKPIQSYLDTFWEKIVVTTRTAVSDYYLQLFRVFSVEINQHLVDQIEMLIRYNGPKPTVD